MDSSDPAAEEPVSQEAAGLRDQAEKEAKEDLLCVTDLASLVLICSHGVLQRAEVQNLRLSGVAHQPWSVRGGVHTQHCWVCGTPNCTHGDTS